MGDTADDLLKRLEEILHKLESEDISLEASFSLYEQGMHLVKDINEKIDRVEKDMIVLEGEGEI